MLANLTAAAGYARDVVSPSETGKPGTPATSADPAASATIRYRERLWVPWYWWPAAFAVAVLLAAEIHMGASGIRSWLPYLLLTPIPVWLLLWMGRRRIEVVDPGAGAPLELRAGPARLPVSFIARAAAVPSSAKSAALGRQLDPAAYVQHTPWVGPLLLIVLDDPDDPVPYWLISTRRPAQVLAALNLDEPAS